MRDNATPIPIGRRTGMSNGSVSIHGVSIAKAAVVCPEGKEGSLSGFRFVLIIGNT